ncbi:hypothetical protein Tco_0607190, partial [Tanacetum coccineum]
MVRRVRLVRVHPLEGLVSVDSDDHDDEMPRNAQKQVLDELDELMSKSKVNQLQDAKEKLIMIIIFEFLNDDYDVFGDKLRKKIQAYEPFVSIPLLTIIFTYTPGSLEGITSLSNGYLLAIDNGYLREFG